MTRKVAALPFDVRPGEVSLNLESVLNGIAQAAEAEAALLALPEKWTTSFLPSYPREILEASDRALDTVHEVAADAGLTVVGSAPGKGEMKPTNEIHFLGAAGNLRPYRKRMMFSPTGEGRGLEAGEELPETVPTPVGRVCAFVCYDLRFPEITRQAFYGDAELIVVPAQWPRPRTEVFELLARARAAENQAWVLACNRAGKADLGDGREFIFPGTALLVNPAGTEAARSEEGEMLVGEADSAAVKEIRKAIPCARDLKKSGLWPG
jgi:omega-amidase